MSDERTRRRLGDDTKGRIADLASGWTVDVPSAAPDDAAVPSAAPAIPSDATRRKPKTVPPPPPGSAARKAMEDAILATPSGSSGIPAAAISANSSGASERSKPTTAAPPPRATTAAATGKASGSVAAIPASAAAAISANSGRVKAPSAPPPIPPPPPIPAPPPIPPQAARAKGATQPPASREASVNGALRIEEQLPLRADPTAVAAPAFAEPPAMPLPPPPSAKPMPEPIDGGLTIPDRDELVPRGEFEEGATSVEQDKLRIAHAQATIKRDAASALLGLAEPHLTAVKPPPVETLLDETAHRMRAEPRMDASASSVAATSRFERGDPTLGDREDATTVAPPSGSRATGARGTLRASAALRRKRGIAGDVRYVATAAFGLRSARQELEALLQRQATLGQSRRRHLVTLGRAAVTSDGFDHPALHTAREQLGAVEEQRSQHAGSVAAADSELARLKRDREAKAKQHATDVAALDAELAGVAKKLEPLEREATAAKKRAAEMREQLRRLDAKIKDTEASLVSVKKDRVDPAAIQADIATLRADRKAVAADEPKLAGELDALAPRIAALEANRAELRERRVAALEAETADQRRSEELLAAIGAKRKVVDRAAADAEAARDKALFALGERLYVDRPPSLAAELAPIDEIDVELGTAERRTMELREILASLDTWKLARGVAVITVAIAAVVAIVWWVLARAL